MLDEIERLRTTVRDMWHERQAANGGASTGPAIRDSELAEQARVDLDTVRAFLVSEDGHGIVLTADGHDLSVSSVEVGYAE